VLVVRVLVVRVLVVRVLVRVVRVERPVATKNPSALGWASGVGADEPG